MKKFLLGIKQNMTQQHKEDGTVQPVTVVTAGPCVVTGVRAQEKNGFTAVQLGFGKKRRAAKPQEKEQAAHGGPFRHVREFRVDGVEGFEKGKTLDVDVFTVGDIVTVVGTSKGRGFAGVVKRHHFAGSPASHGHKDQLRMPGSIGSTAPQRVFKGMRMAGHMGNERVSIRHLEIVGVDTERHELRLKGAVPGARNTLLLIQTER